MNGARLGGFFLIRQSSYDLQLPRDCLRGIAPEVVDAALDKSGGQVLVINGENESSFTTAGLKIS